MYSSLKTHVIRFLSSALPTYPFPCTISYPPYTYANAVRTRYGVIGNEPTRDSDPLDPRRSPRLQKKVRITERSTTPPDERLRGRVPRTPATSATITPLKSPLRKRSVIRDTRGEGADNDKNELVRQPMTFPLQDMRAPIPRTTNLEEPPEGQLPPPPPLLTTNAVHNVEKERDSHRTPQHYARMLFNSLKVVTGQAETLNARLREKKRGTMHHC